MIIRITYMYFMYLLNQSLMHITVTNQPSEYDHGIHPQVTSIEYSRGHQTFEEFLQWDDPEDTSQNRFPNLTKLHRSGRELGELGAVSHPNLESIACYCGSITFLDLDCPQLKTLVVFDSCLEEIKRLHCPLLEKLDLSQNKLLVFPPLDCPLLTKLFLSENVLRFFEGHKYPVLKKLLLNNNAIDSLVLHHEHLEVLDINYNKMTNLDLNCPALVELCVGINRITGVFHTSSRNLKILDLGRTPISGLVLCCPLLEELTTTSTLLEELDVSECPYLTKLTIRAETIKTLNTLEYCSNLQELVYLERQPGCVNKKAMKRFFKQAKLLLKEIPGLNLRKRLCHLQEF